MINLTFGIFWLFFREVIFTANVVISLRRMSQKKEAHKTPFLGNNSKAEGFVHVTRKDNEFEMHHYCCSYTMKPDGRVANHIIVEKSWPNGKETLIISMKLQPNIIHNQLGVISVRNRISRLKKVCIIKSIWRLRHSVDQQTIKDPRLAVNIVMADKAMHASQTLYSLHVFWCTHVELLKKEDFKSY